MIGNVETKTKDLELSDFEIDLGHGLSMGILYFNATLTEWHNGDRYENRTEVSELFFEELGNNAELLGKHDLDFDKLPKALQNKILDYAEERLR